MIEKAKIDKFWKWFSGASAALALSVQNASLLQELDAQVSALNPALSWEIGPGRHERFQLVISPNLDRSLREEARQVIGCAPVIEGWEFYSARRPKEWDYKLVIQRSDGQEPLQLDASAWSFVLLRYPDGSHEVLLQGSDLPSLDDDERWQIAAITLESILGEDVLLDRVTEFELVPRLEPRFAEKQRPIQHLREAVGLG